MYYVYQKHLATGHEQYVGSFDTAKEAVHRIAALYRLDAKSCQQDEYYYFMKKH